MMMMMMMKGAIVIMSRSTKPDTIILCSNDFLKADTIPSIDHLDLIVVVVVVQLIQQSKHYDLFFNHLDLFKFSPSLLCTIFFYFNLSLIHSIHQI